MYLIFSLVLCFIKVSNVKRIMLCIKTEGNIQVKEFLKGLIAKRSV